MGNKSQQQILMPVEEEFEATVDHDKDIIVDALSASDGIFADEDVSNDWIDEINDEDQACNLFEPVHDSYDAFDQELPEQEGLDIEVFLPDSF